MSMDEMARDMRNRFLVAVAFAIPIAIWSELGDRIFGSVPPTPFGMRDDVWEFLLSLPVVFYSSWIFFRGAYLALRVRTLDMVVLVGYRASLIRHVVLFVNSYNERNGNVVTQVLEPGDRE